MGDLNIRTARIYPYKLKLAPSVESRYGAYREGRLVRLCSGSGIEGWGDAAPLPGFSLESISDVDAAWKAMADVTEFGADFDEVVARMPAALAFGLEQAQLSIEGQTRDLLPSALIDPEHRGRIAVAGLVDAPPEAALARCAAIAADGYRNIKIKTGSWRRDEVVRVLEDLRAAVPDQVGIHLDANQGWSFDDACFILEAALHARVEYVEEPLQNPDQLPALAGRSTVPIALDESLRQVEPGSLSELDFARFAVVKPSLLGGIRRSLEYGHAARQVGMTPLISSALESGLGLLWLVALASANVFGAPAGLDTYRYLEEDILASSLEPGSEIDVTETRRIYQTPLFDG